MFKPYELLNSHNSLSCLAGYVEKDDEIENWNEISDKLFDAIHKQEIMYYADAISFLSKYDPSLCESFKLYHEMRYTTDILNFELLATILHQSLLKNDLSKLTQL